MPIFKYFSKFTRFLIIWNNIIFVMFRQNEISLHDNE